MRIWLDPERLNSFQLTPADVANAIRAQNVQVSSGQLGGLPANRGVQLSATVIGKTRLQTPEQFENILLKMKQDGSPVRIQDVAEGGLGDRKRVGEGQGGDVRVDLGWRRRHKKKK